MRVDFYETYDNGVLTHAGTAHHLSVDQFDAKHAHLTEHLTATGEGATGLVHRIEVYAVHKDGTRDLVVAAGYGADWTSYFGTSLFDLEATLDVDDCLEC